ncbi:MAG TPA: hypothetical protein HPQ04_06265 [Rhodospirillaceae bacterium]|nr:hypothetical protein [Rhodospirillaceae bacterium]
MRFPTFPKLGNKEYSREAIKLKRTYDKANAKKDKHLHELKSTIYKNFKTNDAIFSLINKPMLHLSAELACLHKEAQDFLVTTNPKKKQYIGNLDSDEEKADFFPRHHDHEQIKKFVEELEQYFSALNKAAIKDLTKHSD